MEPKDIILFQKNLKKTEIGVRFGKKLLTEPGSLSPKQITGILKLLGAPIPREIEILPDAAQAIITGAAVVNRVSSASSAADLKDVLKPGAQSLGTLSRLGKEFGWIDGKGSAQLAALGDVMMIFASGGTDVRSWISLAMSVGMESARADAEAAALAQMRVYENISNEQKRQADKFVENVQDLQAGRLGFFSFLAESVDELPIMFDSLITNNKALAPLIEKFPRLKFLPKGSWTFEGVGSADTWWGENKEKKVQVSVPMIAKMSNESAFQFLFYNLIGPGAESYLRAREYYLSQGKADIVNVALFSLFDSSFNLGLNNNPLSAFVREQITPYEIGERSTFNRAFKGSSSSIITNFGFTKAEKVFSTDEINYLDQRGNLSPLIENRFTQDAMKDHFSFGEFPGEKQFIGFKWRDLSNLISIMDVFDLVRVDPMFERILAESPLVRAFSFLPSVHQFGLKFQEIQSAAIARRVNRSALANVGYFLGQSDVSKLKQVTIEGGPAIFK